MPPPLRCTPLPLSLKCANRLPKAAQSRSFSSTSQREQRVTRARRALWRWLNTNGANFLQPAAGSTNYLNAYNATGQLKRVVEQAASAAPKNKNDGAKTALDTQDKTQSTDGRSSAPEIPGEKTKIPEETVRDLRVFPQNPNFISQSVLSEEFREAIWERIMKEGQSVREVSAALRVEMSRVGAVVRLKEIEKEWQRIGKPLAKPYSEAVMSMLPKTQWNENPSKLTTHESINDLPVHAATGPQIFFPTSESRHFTRVDAAKVFDKDLLPADVRVPHPELALMHKDYKAGMSRDEIDDRQREREAEEEVKRSWRAAKKARKLAAVTRVQTPRWEFRFTPINVDAIGKDGRGAKGVGWRYGVPLMDRSRAQVKIPTRVE